LAKARRTLRSTSELASSNRRRHCRVITKNRSGDFALTVAVRRTSATSAISQKLAASARRSPLPVPEDLRLALHDDEELLTDRTFLAKHLPGPSVHVLGHLRELVEFCAGQAFEKWCPLERFDLAITGKEPHRCSVTLALGGCQPGHRLKRTLSRWRAGDLAGCAMLSRKLSRRRGALCRQRAVECGLEARIAPGRVHGGFDADV
jgi:hypothetical protein